MKRKEPDEAAAVENPAVFLKVGVGCLMAVELCVRVGYCCCRAARTHTFPCSSSTQKKPSISLQAVNELAIEQFDLPPLKPNDLRVAIKSLGICQSDVHYLRHGRIADFVLRAPMVIGHECAGEVAAVGAAVTSLKVRPEFHCFDRTPPWYSPNSFDRITPLSTPIPQVGDRVALEPGIACLGSGCRQCVTGHYNLCPEIQVRGKWREGEIGIDIISV